MPRAKRSNRFDDYDISVFVNCPFDSRYQPIFEAVVFTIVHCGFRARCALEIDDASQVRIDKIFSIIEECRFGIHDLSRTELDKRSKLPRFNMPLELGLFLGVKRAGRGIQAQKSCLILDRGPYRYQQFASDIAGQDTARMVCDKWVRFRTRAIGCARRPEKFCPAAAQYFVNTADLNGICRACARRCTSVRMNLPSTIIQISSRNGSKQSCLLPMPARRADRCGSHGHETPPTGLYDDIWQAFAVILPVRSVGVMGDFRTYDYVLGLRAVTSTDGMTADFDMTFLGHVATRIVNEVKWVNRVVYDMTSKPPGVRGAATAHTCSWSFTV